MNNIKKPIVPQNITADERKAIEQTINDLKPVLDSIALEGSVKTQLANVAVTIAWRAHHLLGNRGEVSKLSQLMSTRTPVPTDVARSVISGYISPPPGLSRRLRNDHPNNLEAKILACVVDYHAGDHLSAFSEARKLLPLVKSNENREELFKLFHQLWQVLDGEAQEECERIARSLVSHNQRLQAIQSAAIALRQGKGETALTILENNRAEDDVFWLQLKGNALAQTGKLAEAADLFFSSAKQTGASALFHQAGDLAFQAGTVELAVDCYEELTKVEPDNVVARSNLASLYALHIRDARKAANQFRALRKIEPDNPLHTVNLAVTLAQLYETDECLSLYNEVCKKAAPELRAVLGRSLLHLSLGDPDTACASLLEFRTAFWEAPEYLLACMNAAYAAEEEDLAHEALSKLNKLRVEGAVKEDSFRIIHKDEAFEMLKEAASESEKQKQHVHNEMLMGRMPWTWVAHTSTEATYWAWRVRTQDLNWIGDDPINRARFTTYSTNGYHAGNEEDGRKVLLPIQCPPPNTPIVADLSALITLHRLGLLKKTATYFGKILVPQSYLSTVLDDGKKMIIHQRSRHQSAVKIDGLISSGIITTVPTSADNGETMAIVDEFAEADENVYRLVDVITPVYKDGGIDDSTYRRLGDVFKMPSRVDESHPPLKRLQKIQINLPLLESLNMSGILDPVARFFNIHVASNVKGEIDQRLNAIKFQEETRRWHFALWDLICDDERFEFVHHPVPREIKDNIGDDRDFIGFLASIMAQDLKRPLLVDDRTCQAMTLNTNKHTSNAAFGSDAVVNALLSADMIKGDDAAEAMRSLMNWRYRFVTPSLSTLNTFAIRYLRNPPGHPLREIAEYVHDCMRDAGLFGGAEDTDMKESMAIRLYLSWLHLLADWIVSVWSNSEIGHDSARSLTKWCIQELLPSQPRALNGSVKAVLGSSMPKLLISHMLLNLNFAGDGNKISDAIKATQEALNMSDEDYLRTVADILNETQTSHDQ